MNNQENSQSSSISSVSKNGGHNPEDPITWYIAEMKKRPNRIALITQMHDHSLALTGVSASDFHSNARTNINVMAAAYAYYGLDGGQAVFDLYNIEAEAMGQKMIYSDNAMPTIDSRVPLINKKEDLLKIKSPDWINSGRVPFALDITRLNAPMGYHAGAFCAPFSLAVGLRSYPKLMRDMKKDPQFTHDLFTLLVDEILPSYIKVQKELCGIEIALGADAWSAFPNLTPQLMEEWLVPYYLRLTENFNAIGLRTRIIATADYCEERVEHFNSDLLYKCLDIQGKISGGVPRYYLGMGRWQDFSLDPVVDYLESVRKKGKKIILSFGVNARLMRDGPVDAIVNFIRRSIDKLGRDYRLTLILANIPTDTPSIHVHSALAAVTAYGKYPIKDDLNDVKVEIPERESFREYVERMSGESLNMLKMLKLR